MHLRRSPQEENKKELFSLPVQMPLSTRAQRNGMEIESAEKCAVSVLARLTYSFKLFREITVICGDFSQLLSLSFCVIRDSHFLEGSKTRSAIHSPSPHSSISVALRKLMVSRQNKSLRQWQHQHGTGG